MQNYNPFEQINERLLVIEKHLIDLSNKVFTQDTDKDERLTRKSVCQKYKISLPTLHQCMKNGLPFEKIGRKTLFRREELDFFFKSKSNKLKRSY
jgi:hypothetical protein